MTRDGLAGRRRCYDGRLQMGKGQRVFAAVHLGGGLRSGDSLWAYKEALVEVPTGMLTLP